MNKKLYIHIGTGKTGTTTLQKFLDDNDSLLSKKFNIKYVKTHRTDFCHHELCTNSFRIAGNISESDIKNRLLERLDKLINEITESNSEKFIISSENFPDVTEEDISIYLSKLSSYVDLNIIVYFRRQDSFLESWYSQIIKMRTFKGKIQNLKSILKAARVFDYFYHIEKWGKYIDKSNVHVRVYEKQQFYKGNIFNDFMSIFGIDELDGFKFQEKDPNPSLSRDQILLVNAFHDAGLEHFLDDVITKPFTFEPVNTKYFLSPEERTSLVREYDETNKKVASVYLGRSDGRLFYDTLPSDNNESWKEVNQPSIEYLLRTFTHLLLKQKISFDKEIEKLRNKLD